MTDIRAFVAHSFATSDQDTSNPKDEWVVGEFTKLFDQIRKLNPNFSWERADEAQPRGVKDKVISVWEDKNLFIAICTGKERVIPATFNQREQLGALNVEGLIWKTSDWIIQEIGFAIGRGCKLIILLETGVRKPGGLIGDLEYIEFDRNVPSSCFVKLMQMINNFEPKRRTAVSLSNVSLPEPAQVEERIANESEWKQPSSSWTEHQYKLAFHFACLDKDEQCAERISRAYLANNEAKDELNKRVWEAYCEWTRLEFGQGGKLDRLRDLASVNSDSADILHYLALALSHYDLHKESAKAYDAASKTNVSSDDKLNFLGQAILEHVREGKNELEIARDIELLKEAALSYKCSEMRILRTLEKIYRERKDLDTAFLIQHGLAELDPSDAKIRFSLAYEHDAKGDAALSLFHYAKLVPLERDGVTWNNLGVVYNKLGLKALSVQAYRQGQELGETLAASNLAFKFLEEGFLAEAKEICEEAILKPGYHANVLTALSQSNTILNNDTEKRDEIVRSAATIKLNQFLSECGRAISLSKPSSITGKWITPECEIAVNMEGDTFVAKGRFEKGLTAGLGGLLAPLNGAIPVKTETWRVEYSGILRGRVVAGWVIRDRVGENTTVLGSLLSSAVQVFLLLSGDLSEFEVMEKPNGTDPKWYKIQRVEQVTT